MTNPSSVDDDNENCEIESIEQVDENIDPETNNVQSRLAAERNQLRWQYQELYEIDAIESFINEDESVKRRRSISEAVKMSELVLNVQEALHSGTEHDVPKAIENLRKLYEEPFSTMSLVYAPCVVKTVYLCCRYEKCEEVQYLAERCYRRFEPCFGVPEGETFETAFQTEVREFWEQQDNIACDSAKYDWKQFSMDDTCVETDSSINIENNGTTKIEFKPVKDETKVDVKTINIKSESDNKGTIKKDVEDCKSQIKKEISVKIEKNIDDKKQVKEEIDTARNECKPDTKSIQVKREITIGEESMDTDDIEIEYCNVKDFKNSELSVKLEPIDLEKLKVEYDSDKDCYILN